MSVSWAAALRTVSPTCPEPVAGRIWKGLIIIEGQRRLGLSWRSSVRLGCLKYLWPSWAGGTYQYRCEINEAIGEIESVLAAA